MKVASPIPRKHARIEIIPLIDIMFFLLASFMMVSLSQTHMKGIRVNLPSSVAVPQATPPIKKDFTTLRVDADGLVHLDQEVLTDGDVMPRLMQMQKANRDVKVFISGDKEALHGDVIKLLDRVRSAHIEKVGYEIRVKAGAGGGGAPGGPAAPPPPPPPAP
ncbi:MAG: biopolymer transporter ExbD [Verrucomicrobiota bacterium]|nr:biopolymer transporter ExbD [Verrucomicrobiota bacterium]